MLVNVLVDAVNDEAVHVDSFCELDPFEQVHCLFIDPDEAFLRSF